MFAALAALGVVLLPRLRFDSDPLHTKNPNTEAMRTLYDLMDSPVTNPFTIDILAREPGGRRGACRSGCDSCRWSSGVLSIDSFVPEDQKAKLAQIQDAALLLGPTLAPLPAGCAAERGRDPRRGQGRAARRSRRRWRSPRPIRSSWRSPAICAGWRRRPIRWCSPPIAALTRFLPTQLDQLRSALSAQPVTLAEHPAGAGARLGAARRARARPGVAESRRRATAAGWPQEFVAEVTAVAPDAGGPAVTIEATSATIVGSFRSAALAALVAITVILFVALRRPLDVSLVLAPLLLSSLMTVIVMVLAAAAAQLRQHHRAAAAAGGRRLVQHLLRDELAGRANRGAGLGHRPGDPVLGADHRHRLRRRWRCRIIRARRAWGTLLLISLGCTLVASLVFIPALLAAVPLPAAPAGRRPPSGRARASRVARILTAAADAGSRAHCSTLGSNRRALGPEPATSFGPVPGEIPKRAM